MLTVDYYKLVFLRISQYFSVFLYCTTSLGLPIRSTTGSKLWWHCQLLLGWEVRCDTINTIKRPRVEAIFFLVWKACFGVCLPWASYYYLLYLIPGLAPKLQVSRHAQVPLVIPALLVEKHHSKHTGWFKAKNTYCFTLKTTSVSISNIITLIFLTIFVHQPPVLTHLRSQDNSTVVFRRPESGEQGRIFKQSIFEGMVGFQCNLW